MTGVPQGSRRQVYFCFADPTGFSGQKAATEIVIRGLSRRGWSPRRLPLPVLERGDQQWLALPRFLFATLLAWLRALRLLAGRGSWLCVNMGQTRAAFLRDSVPLLVGRIGLGREGVVVSLHSSLFMGWENDSVDARAFRLLLGMAGAVTVLGEGQRRRLIDLGIPSGRLVTVVNTCELEPISKEDVTTKFAVLDGDRTKPVCLLHLSSLVDTKGFPEYLGALARISEMPGPVVEAVLCGPLSASDFSGPFGDLAKANAWIEDEMAAINRGKRVRVKWIKGAAGAEKAALFREAHIFVLPTRYAVEAQPLVLLEAMASGCAVVTTRIGEITTILDEECAVLLNQPTVEALTGQLQDLVGNVSEIGRLALAAHGRYVDRYGMESHIDQWERLLARTGGRPGGNA